MSSIKFLEQIEIGENIVLHIIRKGIDIRGVFCDFKLFNSSDTKDLKDSLSLLQLKDNERKMIQTEVFNILQYILENIENRKFKHLDHKEKKVVIGQERDGTSWAMIEVFS